MTYIITYDSPICRASTGNGKVFVKQKIDHPGNADKPVRKETTSVFGRSGLVDTRQSKTET